MKKNILYLILFLNLTGLARGELKLPNNCQPIAITSATVDFSSFVVQNPTLIIIHNLAKTNLWLTLHDEVANYDNLSSMISADHWAAIIWSHKSSKFSCIETRPGHEQQISCEGMVFLCRWEITKSKKDIPANFWLAENMSLPILLEHLSSHGFANAA